MNESNEAMTEIESQRKGQNGSQSGYTFGEG